MSKAIATLAKRAGDGIGMGRLENADCRKEAMADFFLLGQWLNFKLFGITYLVGKIKFKLFFSGSIG